MSVIGCRGATGSRQDDQRATVNVAATVEVAALTRSCENNAKGRFISCSRQRLNLNGGVLDKQVSEEVLGKRRPKQHWQMWGL